MAKSIDPVVAFAMDTARDGPLLAIFIFTIEH